ncbi:MAG: DUF4249 domain-containing protein [Bacteroidales bacterium]|nr:DUF4249 domain-containing protein [Bacteroidales bacterium]
MKKLAYIFRLAILISGCTERIEIDLGTTYDRLVVEGHVSTDTAMHWIRLTKSTDYYSGKPAPAISAATVNLYDGYVDVQLNEYDSMPGYYFTPADYFGVVGRMYEMTVNLAEPVNGQSVFYASSELRPVGSVDSIRVEYNEDWEGWEVKIFAWEPPTTDFYKFLIYKNDTLMSDTINKVWISDDRYFNGNYTFGATIGFLDEDTPREVVHPGDVITMKMSGITKDYYNFILQLQDQTFQYRNPLFSGPPANIITNISEGGCGFFSAYSNTSVSTTYK